MRNTTEEQAELPLEAQIARRKRSALAALSNGDLRWAALAMQEVKCLEMAMIKEQKERLDAAIKALANVDVAF